MFEPTAQRGYRRLMGFSAVALVAFVLLVGAGVLFSANRSTKVKTSDETRTHSGVQAVQADMDSGNLIVRVAGDGTTTVARHLRWTEGTHGPPSITEELTGSTLVLRERGCGTIVLFYRCDADLTLTVPASAGLSIKSDSGTVTVAGTTGTVQLTMDSGTAVLTNVSGDLTVRSDSGRVKATGLAAKAADVQTDSGEVRLEFATAPSTVQLVTDSGRLTMLVPQNSGPYAVAATSDSGSRRIGVSTSDTATAHRVTMRSDSGSLTVDYLG